MAQAITNPLDVPPGEPQGIIIHVLKENKRPIGFAPWPKTAKRKKRREKK